MESNDGSYGCESDSGNDAGAEHSSQRGKARGRRTSYRSQPYFARPFARRSLDEALSPDNIQLAQNSPRFSEPGASSSGEGAVDAIVCSSTNLRSSPRPPPSPRSPPISQGTPPVRRSPRLALRNPVADSRDTPESAALVRVLPIDGMDTALNSAVLAQQRLRDDTRSPFGENAAAYECLYRLVVTPIVKTAVSQRDTSGDALEVYAVEGPSFTAILKKLWEKFREHMKGRAVKNQNEWSIVAPSMEEWSQMMQFKSKRHLVDSTKTEQAWNVWLNTIRGESVKLLVFQYGAAIATLPSLIAFKKVCIDPLATDRSGAADELSLQEVVEQLQQKWELTFQGPTVIWRMWANHIIRNLNRSTWEAAIDQPPPEYVAKLLRAAGTRTEQQVSGMSRSAKLALDCVNAAIATNNQFIQDWEAFGRRLKENDKCLAARKEVIEGFINNVLPPRDVINPLQAMENINDVDHE